MVIRQRAVRVPIEGVSLRIAAASGHLVNISATGALVRATEPLTPPFEDPIYLDLPTDRVQLTGRVIRSSAAASEEHMREGEDYLVAVRFTVLPPGASIEFDYPGGIWKSVALLATPQALEARWGLSRPLLALLGLDFDNLPQSGPAHRRLQSGPARRRDAARVPGTRGARGQGGTALRRRIVGRVPCCGARRVLLAVCRSLDVGARSVVAVSGVAALTLLAAVMVRPATMATAVIDPAAIR